MTEKEEPTIKELLKQITFTDLVTRGHAIIRLLEIGDRSTIKPIMKALEIEVSDIHWSVLKMLLNGEGFKELDEVERIELGINVGGMLYEFAEFNEIWQEIFPKVGKKAFAPLIKTLESENRWIRSMSIQSLREIGDSRAIPSLIQILHDEDIHVRGWVLHSLYWLGGINEVTKSADIRQVIKIIDEGEWMDTWDVQYEIEELVNSLQEKLTRKRIE